MTQRPDGKGPARPHQDSSAEKSANPWESEVAIELSDDEALVGVRAGEYELAEFIGGGAMGRVYRARKRGLQRQRAIKVLRPSDGQAEGLLHEAIDHPNVVAVEDIGTLTDRNGATHPYIVMELLGRHASLDRWMKMYKPSLNERLRLVEEAARGVAYAHSLGVSHHDLKPANILVDRFFTAKVADFGLARLRIEAGQESPGGTLAYQSPEQCLMASNELDERSDVYGLGATLFSVLTNGDVPVALPPRASREETYQAKTEHPPRFGLLPVDTPASIQAILKRALAPNRSDRYDTVAHFADALANARARRLRAGGRLRAWYAKSWRTRPRITSWMHAVLVGVLVAGALTTVVRDWAPFEAWHLRRLPAIEAALPQTFGDVRIVRLPEPEQITQMPALAQSLAAPMDEAERTASGLGLVRASPRTTWRPMYGAFIDAMGEASAKTIAFDLYLPSEWDDLDPPLAVAIERSVERRVPVVIGAKSWQLDEDGLPAMSRALLQAGARWGSLFVEDGALPGIPLGGGPENELWQPGFVSATYAAASERDARPDFALRGQFVRSQYWTPSEVIPGEKAFTGRQDFLSPANFLRVRELKPDMKKDRPDDWIMAYAQRAILDINAIDNATLSFVELMEATPEQRSVDVAGRVLVVVEPTDDTTFELGLERPVLGGELLAGAVEALLQRRTSRWASDWQVVLCAVGAGTLGACAGAMLWAGRLAPRWRRGVAAVALIMAGIGCLAVLDRVLIWLYLERDLIVQPVTPALSLCIACVVGFTLPACVRTVPRSFLSSNDSH